MDWDWDFLSLCSYMVSQTSHLLLQQYFQTTQFTTEYFIANSQLTLEVLGLYLMT